jgi:DNA anti-recombination protein RmuC
MWRSQSRMSLLVAAAKWASKGARGARRRKPFAECIEEAFEANHLETVVQAAEEAANKSAEARAARAEAQTRSGDRFAKAKTSVPLRSLEDRLQAENKFVREKLASIIAEHNASRKRTESEIERLLYQSQQRIKEQEGELRRLRRSFQAFKFKHA